MNIGEQIMKLRESAGLTRAQLAERAGLTRMSVWKVEARNMGKFETIQRIAAALGRDAEVRLVKREGSDG